MENLKTCKECNIEKMSSEFYGSQGECKVCTKERVRRREEKLRQNPDWYEKEKARHRDKYYRLGYKELHKSTPENKKIIIERHNDKYPEKYHARNACQHIKKEKGNELHHWCYNELYHKDVIELNKADHALLHRYIKYDNELMMYRNLEGILLDTKESHLLLIKQIKELETV